MEKYIDYEMCKKCGGECCKQNGCVYMPKDFESMEFSYLKDVLEEGRISISGQPTEFASNAWTYVPYLRARNKDAAIVDLITNGGPCINLTPNGCSLSEEKRPTFGLLVKPTKIGGPCEKVNSVSAEEWLNYSEVLERLVKYYTNKDIIDIIVDETAKKILAIKKKKKANIKLNPMELQNAYWYFAIMNNKPYYTPDEVKKMIFF